MLDSRMDDSHFILFRVLKLLAQPDCRLHLVAARELAERTPAVKYVMGEFSEFCIPFLVASFLRALFFGAAASIAF